MYVKFMCKRKPLLNWERYYIICLLCEVFDISLQPVVCDSFWSVSHTRHVTHKIKLLYNTNFISLDIPPHG